MIKPGATVIDVGITRITDEQGKTKLVGDVDYDGKCLLCNWSLLINDFFFDFYSNFNNFSYVRSCEYIFQIVFRDDRTSSLLKNKVIRKKNSTT